MEKSTGIPKSFLLGGHKITVTTISAKKWPYGDGVDTGTLAEPYGPQFNYTEAGPVNWASGFAVLSFHEGRLLEPELCVVMDGKAWFRGEPV